MERIAFPFKSSFPIITIAFLYAFEPFRFDNFCKIKAGYIQYSTNIVGRFLSTTDTLFSKNLFMQIKKSFVLPLFMLFLTSFSFMACESDSPASASGEVQLKITDAPSDDSSIEGVFVTVAEVKVDGESYEGFQGKQTIDIMAYQNGRTKALGLADLEAGSYSRLTLVLDTETDENGNAPGCYVARANNEKDDLRANGESTIEITSQKSFEVVENARSSIVLDFDLRKCMQYESNAGSTNAYSFVSQAELNSSLRVVSESSSGSIEGSFDTSIFTDPEKVVVYAYKKGSFNKESETQAQGSGQVQFSNAVSSTTAVEGSGSYGYNISFLEEGDYEVCMVAYEDSDDDGDFEFQGFLNASVFVGGAVTTEVSVSAGAAATLNLDILGIIN